MHWVSTLCPAIPVCPRVWNLTLQKMIWVCCCVCADTQRLVS